MLLILFVGCRCRRVSVATDTLGRTYDSVIRVQSLAAREFETVTEETFVTLRPDSLGNMVETSRDIRRKVTRGKDVASNADTTVTAIQETRAKETEKTDEKTEPKEARQSAAAFVAGVWVAFVLLAVFLVLTLWTKWKSRT